MKHTRILEKESKPQRPRGFKKRGVAMYASFAILVLMSVASVSYIDTSTETVRNARRLSVEVQTTHLCESGVQDVLRTLWRPFKQDQNFLAMDATLTGAGEGSPRSALSGNIAGVGAFSAGVIRYEQPPGNAFVRNVTIRSVGWIDQDADGTLDAGESSRIVDVTARFELARSQVFDYTYFVNNYGWMDGFNANDLVVNGDMRANGNFNFLNGSPTVNGSVLATNNDKLVPGAVGLINAPPIKMATSTYSTWTPANPPRLSGESTTAYNARVANFQNMIASRRRPAWNQTSHGVDNSDLYEETRDFVYRGEAAIIRDRPAGAVIADSSGIRSWTRTGSAAGTTQVLDTSPTREVIMPDLSDLNRYMTMSQTYRNTQATFLDGTPNPNFNQGAFVEIWNTTTSSYERISTNGVINGSAVLVGTPDRPIRIHGPVTITQDAVIKGTITGQGTLYTGRNVHIVGSIRYANGPDFRGSSVHGTDLVNERRDFLGLAARGSVIMGNPTTFGNPYPLAYMTPMNPPTKTVGTLGRFDENGNWIPPFDANQVDSTGRRRFQSVIADTTMNAIAEGVNQIDAVIYTNFVGGGNIGTGGGGVVFNGSIISRDEAMVTWSLPVIMNYDNRIRERSVTQAPLIDLNLPRSPVLLRSTWQDRGFTYGSVTTTTAQ